MYQRKYRVILTCWNYQNPTPYADSVEKFFESEEAAIAAIVNSVSDELESLNSGRELLPVFDSDGYVVAHDFPFRADESGDFSNIIRFWDGDDYQNVTQYDICPVDFLPLESGKFSEHSCIYRGFEIYSNPQHNRFRIQNGHDDFTWATKHTLKSALAWVDNFELEAKFADNTRKVFVAHELGGLNLLQRIELTTTETKKAQSLLKLKTYSEMSRSEEELVSKLEYNRLVPEINKRLGKGQNFEQIMDSIHDLWGDYQLSDLTEDMVQKRLDTINSEDITVYYGSLDNQIQSASVRSAECTLPSGAKAKKLGPEF